MTNSQPPIDECTIVLNGGPRNGSIMVISPDIQARGRLIVPILPTVRWEENPSIAVEMKTGVYVRVRKFAGEPNTCEFRTWTEWHWKG